MSEEKSEPVVIEIDEPVVEEEQSFDTEGLLPEEIEMAKEHDLIKEEVEDGEQQEQPKPETTEDTGTEEEEKPEEEVENPTFEQVEAKEELISKYNPNEKALFYRWKTDKQKRQAAQKELEEVKSSSEFQSLKESVSAKKLAAIEEALSTENLTVEQLQAIINGKVQESQEDKKYTMAEIEAMKKEEGAVQAKKQEVITQRVQMAEQIGKSRFDNFEQIIAIAQEVVSEDTDGVYQEVINKAFNDINIDEDKIVDKIVKFAKLSPKFKELTSKASPEEQEKVGRVIKNSKKRPSSASITGSGGRRAVNEEDLTQDDVGKMSTGQWNKLSRKTRDRLLGKPS